MQYMYAALLLHKAGKKVEEDGMKKVIAAAGGQPDDARIKAVVSALEGVDIEKAIQEAATVQVAAAPAASGGAAPAAEQKAKKEEEKKSDESAAAGLSALFG